MAAERVRWGRLLLQRLPKASVHRSRNRRCDVIGDRLSQAVEVLPW